MSGVRHLSLPKSDRLAEYWQHHPYASSSIIKISPTHSAQELLLTPLHEKEYEVTLDRPIRPLEFQALKDGFILDGTKTKPLKAWKTAPKTIHIVLTEGRNRQIRRMCQHIGYTVKSLSRVRIMTLTDPHLRPSTVRPLTESERGELLKALGIEGV